MDKSVENVLKKLWMLGFVALAIETSVAVTTILQAVVVR